MGLATAKSSSSSSAWMTITRSAAARTSRTRSISPRTTIRPAMPPRTCWGTPPRRGGGDRRTPRGGRGARGTPPGAPAGGRRGAAAVPWGVVPEDAAGVVPRHLDLVVVPAARFDGDEDVVAVPRGGDVPAVGGRGGRGPL